MDCTSFAGSSAPIPKCLLLLCSLSLDELCTDLSTILELTSRQKHAQLATTFNSFCSFTFFPAASAADETLEKGTKQKSSIYVIVYLMTLRTFLYVDCALFFNFVKFWWLSLCQLSLNLYFSVKSEAWRVTHIGKSLCSKMQTYPLSQSLVLKYLILYMLNTGIEKQTGENVNGDSHSALLCGQVEISP